jgi:tetratricopeptide (TPR) repeat protein
MYLRLESKIAKLVTFAIIGLLLTPYCMVAWSRYHASTFAAGSDRNSLERAVQLQPGDAAYQERLARYDLFVEQDAPSALVHYQMAAAMNPYSARNWLGIAQSQLILGDTNSALKAIDRALDVDPHTPSVTWESGNLLVALGQVPRAMQQFQYTLANDPTMVGQGLQLIRRLESPAEAAKIALPPDPPIFITLINMLLQSKDIKGAQQVWPELIALHKPFDPKLSYYYIWNLLSAGEFDAATQAWSDLEKTSPEIARLRRKNNLILNPSFEYPVLNGGFEWLLPDAAAPDPLLQTDISDAHEGRRSLMATFDGTRSSQLGLRQLLLLDPNSQYRFTGYIKADLETANGLRFVIIDAKTGQRLLQTDDVVDGKRWIPLIGEFRTGAERHLAYLSIERSGSTLVRGTAWIDDLQLVKEPQ